MISIKKEKYCTAIIGNGAMSESLVMGQLNSGFKNHQILVISRSNSDTSSIAKMGVSVSNDFSDIAKINPTHIILAVDKSAAGYALLGLKNAGLNEKWGYKIISLIPGLSTRKTGKILGGIRHRTILARPNIGIRFNRSLGSISVSEESGLMEYLGCVEVEEDFKKVENSIFSNSFLTGCNIPAIDILAQELELSLGQYINRIISLASSQQLYKSLSIGSEMYMTSKYISTITDVFSKQFNYRRDDFRDVAIATFMNSIKIMKEVMENDLPDSPGTLIKANIGTDYLSKISNKSHLTSYDFMWNEVFAPFKAEIDDSYKIVNESILAAFDQGQVA